MTKQQQNDEWKEKVRGILKAEIARRNIKQAELVGMLEKAYGVKETPQSLSNKIGRGTFSAIFMFQILEVIGCEKLSLDVPTD